MNHPLATLPWGLSTISGSHFWGIFNMVNPRMKPSPTSQQRGGIKHPSQLRALLLCFRHYGLLILLMGEYCKNFHKLLHIPYNHACTSQRNCFSKWQPVCSKSQRLIAMDADLKTALRNLRLRAPAGKADEEVPVVKSGDL